MIIWDDDLGFCDYEILPDLPDFLNKNRNIFSFMSDVNGVKYFLFSGMKWFLENLRGVKI